MSSKYVFFFVAQIGANYVALSFSPFPKTVVKEILLKSVGKKTKRKRVEYDITVVWDRIIL